MRTIKANKGGCRWLCLVAILAINWLFTLSVNGEVWDECIRIVDAQTDKGIPYSTAYMKHLSAGMLADENGIGSMKMGQKSLGDTVIISSIGYERLICPLANIDCKVDTLKFQLVPKTYPLNEVNVSPAKKAKILKKGKRHSGGILKTAFHESKGTCYAWEVGKEKHRTWLSSITLQCIPYSVSAEELAQRDSIYKSKGSNLLYPLKQLRFRINIYDALDKTSKNHGFERYGYINILHQPIIIDYSLDKVVDNAFVYTFQEPILLPEKSLVEIEFLDDMPENEFIIFKSNIFGKNILTRAADDHCWFKLPVAVPFTIELIDEKL